MNRPPLIQVVSFGGGTQSACIALLICLGILPKPDFVLIADTGRERATTWAYWDAVVRPALESAGLTCVRVGPEWQSNAHKENWQSGKTGRTVLLPCFSSYEGAGHGKLRSFCSSRWKADVIARYLSKAHGITRSMHRRWIGFSLDEGRRIRRMMDGADYKAGLVWFPLVEGLPIPFNRRDSIEFVMRHGWPEPPRSACYCCPNQSHADWQRLRENSPAEFEAACVLDENIRQVDPWCWLHRSCVPLREVDFARAAEHFDAEPCDTGEACFV